MPQRKDILQQSFIDAEALEMIRSYHLEPDGEYELQKRQDDYYFTLISSMCRLMKDLLDDNKAGQAEENREKLLEIAKGLLLYSDPNTQTLFNGVNQVNNTLFVAAIYYVCQYEAIASLVLRRLWLTQIRTISGRKMYYVIKAPYINPERYSRYAEIAFLDAYVQTGEVHYIQDEIDIVEQFSKNNEFPTVREFFDAQIYKAVLKKFLKHNIRTTLYSADPATDWQNYIEYSRRQSKLSFLPSQEDAIENGLLTFKRSFCLGMSTSAGKSYITELIVFQEIQKNPQAKILYLAPLRSLSRELTQHYRKVSKQLNFKVRSSYGGHVSEIEDASMEKAQLFIATPEAFMSVDVDFADFSLIICDEGQIIDDESRGIEYELLLTRLRQYEHLRFLFLSAILPNLSDINVWIGGEASEVGDSTYRPCKQRLGVFRDDGNHYLVDMLDAESGYETVNYSIPLSGERPKGNERKEQCSVVAQNAKNAGVVMVFAYMKNLCKNLVEQFLNDTNQKQEKEHSDLGKQVIEYCAYQLGDDFELVNCLRRGIAYHHADLPQDIREYIEQLLEGGDIRVVICTSTLAEGVNFPIKTLILAYINYIDEVTDYKGFIGAEKIKNIVGRVGRAGRETYGTIIMMEPKFMKYVLPAMQNDIKRTMQGTLYRRLHLGETQNEQWREDEKLVAAIDYNITKSRGNEDLASVNIRELAMGSFAYKFCNEDEQKRLVSIFEERYETLKTFFETYSYDSYKISGLSISEIERIEEAAKDLIDDLKECQRGDIPGIVERLIALVKGLKLPGDVEKVKKNKKPIFTIENLIGVVHGWVTGKTYKAISEKVGIGVEETIVIVNRLTTMYAFKIQSILTYLKDAHDIENPVIDNIANYIQYGVCNDLMLYLLSEQLANRLAVHVINGIVHERGWEDHFDEEILKDVLRAENKVMDRVNELSIPILTKIKIGEWIDYKNRLPIQ